MNRPFDIAPPADYPQTARILPFPRRAAPRARPALVDAPAQGNRFITPLQEARILNDEGMLNALAEEAAYDDFLLGDRTRLGTPADPFARLNKQVEPVVVTLAAKLVVGGAWAVCLAYCVAIWTGVAAEFGL